MLAFFTSFASCYIKCDNNMPVLMDGPHNFTISKGKWLYFYSFFNATFDHRIKIAATTTGPTKFFMQDFGKCPFFGDPIILETKGKTYNESISPYLPSKFMFSVGVYSEADNNYIDFEIKYVLPPPKWKKDLPKYIKFATFAIVASFASYFLVSYIMSKSKKPHPSHKNINRTAKGRKKIH